MRKDEIREKRKRQKRERGQAQEQLSLEWVGPNFKILGSQRKWKSSEVRLLLRWKDSVSWEDWTRIQY